MIGQAATSNMRAGGLQAASRYFGINAYEAIARLSAAVVSALSPVHKRSPHSPAVISIDTTAAQGKPREADRKDRRRIVVTLIEEAITAVRQSFAVPNPSLRELCQLYEASQLDVIADFLTRNAQRLREDMALAPSQ